MANQDASRLADISLFKNLPTETLEQIAERCNWHEYDEDEVVFDDKSESLDVYFVIDGRVRAYTDALYKNQRDKEVTFAEFTAGDYFGELAAIDGKPRSAHIKATEETLLASLEGSAFVDLMENTPKVAFRVVKRFAGIIRSLDRRVTELSTLSETERVYAELVRIAMPDSKRPNGWIIPVMPKHQDLASWSGTSREVVAQVIGDLARNNVVERRSLSLVINDWQRLQLLARS